MQVEYAPLLLPLKEVEIRQYNWPLLASISFIPFPLKENVSDDGGYALTAIWKIKPAKTTTI